MGAELTRMRVVGVHSWPKEKEKEKSQPRINEFGIAFLPHARCNVTPTMTTKRVIALSCDVTRLYSEHHSEPLAKPHYRPRSWTSLTTPPVLSPSHGYVYLTNDPVPSDLEHPSVQVASA